MAHRILTVLVLLAVAGEAAAQLPPSRQPPPPPIAPAAGTQIDAADRSAILIAAATFLRVERVKGDSIVLDPRYHGTPGPAGDLRNLNLSHGDIPAEELQILLGEMRAVTGTLESVQRNCRPGFGCELTVPHYVAIGPPILRADGTVTITVEHLFRTSSTRQPTTMSGFVLLLTRTDDTWSVRGACPCVIT